jgi:hypothetical protein
MKGKLEGGVRLSIRCKLGIKGVFDLLDGSSEVVDIKEFVGPAT